MELKEGVAHIARDEEIDFDELNEALPDAIVLELIRPMEFGGEGETTELRFEEPTGHHVERMQKAGSEKAQAQASWAVLGECTGLAPEEVKDIRGRDLSRLGQVLEYFLPSRRRETP